ELAFDRRQFACRGPHVVAGGAVEPDLSPRTVEDHLSRILRKLDLTGRAGIAHKLGELEPPAG
ncbi:LuxR C-terminal-related transcriptional regulator, partial [Nocardia xishanensis]